VNTAKPRGKFLGFEEEFVNPFRRSVRTQSIRSLLLLGALSAGATTLVAQSPRPSQHGSVTQEVAGTKITIEYNRPVARGRELFGALIPWGRVWNPGADNATTISVSTNVQVNGKALPAGTYSLWAEPDPKNWTIIFSRAQPVWHTPYPAGRDALRVTVDPRTGPHMETLAFYFPVVDGKHAELVLHWGTVVVPVQFDAP